MMKKYGLKIGVIGLGFIGEIYVKHLLDNPEVYKVFIVSHNLEKRELFKAKYQKVEVFEDFRDMIENVQLHGVCVCTPNYSHAEIAQYIINNKHTMGILLEKPVAISKEQLNSLIETAQRKNRMILVSHSLRFATPYVLAKKQLGFGRIGKTLYIEGRYKWFKNFSGWKGLKQLSGGGFLIQSGIHIIDAFIWYADSPVVGVSGHSAKLFHKNIEVEDTFFAELHFSNGVFAKMIGSSATKGFIDYGLEIYGTQGSIKVRSNALPGGLEILNHTISIFNERSDLSPYGALTNPSLPNHDLWKEEVNHFVNCLLGKDNPLVSIQEAKKAMDVCFALYESDRQDGKYIDLYGE